MSIKAKNDTNWDVNMCLNKNENNTNPYLRIQNSNSKITNLENKHKPSDRFSLSTKHKSNKHKPRDVRAEGAGLEL